MPSIGELKDLAAQGQSHGYAWMLSNGQTPCNNRAQVIFAHAHENLSELCHRANWPAHTCEVFDLTRPLDDAVSCQRRVLHAHAPLPRAIFTLRVLNRAWQREQQLYR